MPTFFTKSGSFQDLTVTGSRLYVASSSIFFNNLTTSSTTVSNVLVISSSGQIYFTASSALPSTTQTFNTSSFITTGSISTTQSITGSLGISGSNITITGSVNITGSLNATASWAVSASQAISSSYATTASYALNGGSGGTTYFIATGSVTASVNVVTSSIFQITSGSSTFMIINNSGSIGIGTTTPNVYGGIYSGSVGLQVKDKLAVFNGDGTGSGILITGNSGGRTYMTKDGSAFVAYQDNISSVAKKWLQVSNAIDDETPLLQLQDSIAGNGKYTKWTINASSSFDYNTTFAIRQYSNNHTYTFGIFNTTNNRVFTVKPNGDGFYSGSLFIGTGSIDKGYKLMVSGSDISGSFNANNVLFVSGSNVSISGSFTVVSGSTEFQVLGTGIKIGNTGSDAHTMTGSFGIQVAPVGTNQPGGIRVSAGVNNVDYATDFVIGKYNLTAQSANELYFSASSATSAGPYFVGTQLYMGQASPRIIFGSSSGPNNVSYMSVGANTGSEYRTSSGVGGYPSGSNNFFLINTNLESPNPGTNQRRSLYIGAQDIRFFVSASTNNDSFSSATPVMTIGSGSTVTITGSTNVLTVRGSGSISPIFTVQGSQGELFSVTDSLTGSLFSVNDISGLPILDINSDQTTKIGSYLAPGMYASTKVTANTGVTVIYSIPTASYDSAYFDYNIRSGSVGRAGNIIAMWSGSSVNYSEVSASSFGTTSTFVLGVSISGSNMILSGSAPTNGWTVKTIIRSI
jgi:hypothetical protein